jgi:hypothetical protein
VRTFSTNITYQVLEEEGTNDRGCLGMGFYVPCVSTYHQNNWSAPIDRNNVTLPRAIDWRMASSLFLGF